MAAMISGYRVRLRGGGKLVFDTFADVISHYLATMDLDDDDAPATPG